MRDPALWTSWYVVLLLFPAMIIVLMVRDFVARARPPSVSEIGQPLHAGRALVPSREPVMKSFGLAVLAAIGGYVIGLFGGMFFIEIFSTNRHDKSLEAAMTGAFVLGPLMAIVAVIVVWIFRSRQAR